MRWGRLIRISLTSLATNKLRTLLAVLGIVIGVAAVILMIGLGRGAEQQTAARITSLGSNLMFVRPGFSRRRMVRTAPVRTLVAADARALESLRPLVDAVVPEATVSAQVKYFSRNTSTTVLGTTPDYFPARNFRLREGRAWSATEGRIRSRVCVLGAEVATALFGEGQTIGRRLKIRGVSFEVIGLLEAKGAGGWQNPDDQILVPLATVQKRLGAGDHLRGIAIQVADPSALGELEQQVTALLRRRHRIPAGRDPDFSIVSQEEILRTRGEVAQTFTLLLSGIALVSLIVGGIGIMNIMLVSVAERTREIGILKAIGARRRDILRQFLIEAVAVCFAGGVLGVATGVGGCFLLPELLGGIRLVLSWDAVLVSFCFAAVTGIFFGWYPALHASRMDPIEALRHE